MNNHELKDNIRQYLPNTMTFFSLGFGFVSIILATQEDIMLAGLFVVISVILDAFDGMVARKLNAASNFGMQLDSLADLVNFGVAPVILVLQHLTVRGLYRIWFIPLLILPVVAGAFRLARFNLQPEKQGVSDETSGITITNSGIILSLAVLSDLSNPHASLAQGSYSILLLILSYLMISKLKFPSYTWIFPSKRFVLMYLILGMIVFYFSSLFTAVMIFFLGGLAASIIRKLYHRLFQGVQSL